MLRSLISLALSLAITSSALAQSWPQKPVRFIVPFPPGGATDISARLLGEKLSQMWGQQVIIENRGGAGGGVGAAEAARATPDGYTLFFPSGSVVTANQHIYAKMNYDPEKDFVPVTNVVSGPQVLAVRNEGGAHHNLILCPGDERGCDDGGGVGMDVLVKPQVRDPDAFPDRTSSLIVGAGADAVVRTDPLERFNLIEVPAYVDTVVAMRNRLWDTLEKADAMRIPLRRGDWQACEKLVG